MNGRPEDLAPLARTAGLVVREVDGEVLIFDRENYQARCLDSVAGSVWKRCDGRTSVTQIAAELGLDVHAVYGALAELSRGHLLDEQARLGVISRGQMMKRAGAAIVTIPVITTLASGPGIAHAAGNGWGSNFGGNTFGSTSSTTSGTTSGTTTQSQPVASACPDCTGGMSPCKNGPTCCGFTPGTPCSSAIQCCGNGNCTPPATVSANCHPGCCTNTTSVCGVCSGGVCQSGGQNFQVCSG